MGYDINLLPPEYQKQALKKLSEQQAPAKAIVEMPAAKAEPKYHNIPTEVKNIKFQSKHEGERFGELMLEFMAGTITDLRLQVNFTLLEGYTTLENVRIRPIVYKADFTHYRGGKYVVEDAKSRPTKTKVYMMKKKMLRDKYGIDIVEV